MEKAHFSGNTSCSFAGIPTTTSSVSGSTGQVSDVSTTEATPYRETLQPQSTRGECGINQPFSVLPESTVFTAPESQPRQVALMSEQPSQAAQGISTQSLVFADSVVTLPPMDESEGVILSISDLPHTGIGQQQDIVKMALGEALDLCESFDTSNQTLSLQHQPESVWSTAGDPDAATLQADEDVQYRLLMAECKALVDDEYNRWDAQRSKIEIPIEKTKIDCFFQQGFDTEDEIRGYYQAVLENCGYQRCIYLSNAKKASSCHQVFTPLQLRLHLFEYHNHEEAFRCGLCKAPYMVIEALDIHIKTEPNHRDANCVGLYISRKDVSAKLTDVS